MLSRMYHKFLSILLTIALLLSGMCFDDVHADSSFSYEYCKNVTFRSVCSDQMPTTPKILSGDRLGQRDVITSLKRIGHTEEKSGSRTDSYLSFVGTLPQFSVLRFITITGIAGNCVFSNTVIVDYIHQKDGKKG